MAESVEVGRFMRLRGAIQGALDAIPVDQAAVAGRAMAARYRIFRHEAQKVVPKGYLDELESLFPEAPIAGGRRDVREEAETYNQARGLLGALAGWLDGFIQEARSQAETEAYVRERVKQERGVGFKAGDKRRL